MSIILLIYFWLTSHYCDHSMVMERPTPGARWEYLPKIPPMPPMGITVEEAARRLTINHESSTGNYKEITNVIREIPIEMQRDRELQNVQNYFEAMERLKVETFESLNQMCVEQTDMTILEYVQAKRAKLGTHVLSDTGIVPNNYVY